MITKRINQTIALACFTLLMSLLVACDDDSDGGGSSGTGGTVAETGGAGTTAAGSGGAGTTAAGTGGDMVVSDASTTNDGSMASDTGSGSDAATADAAQVPADLDYSDMSLWMCTPDDTDNPCKTDMQATEVKADNSKGDPIPLEVKSDAAFDCFYVYPTMDLEFVPGNHTDLTDVAAFDGVASVQVARFSTVCKVYAPYYRQMKIGAYQAPDFQDYFDFAYNDVSRAFDYYMANFNAGRNIVFISHSQGSHLLTRLISEKFDGSTEMRNMLISALLIGSSDIFVPEGQKVGGTFANIPLCSSDTETGCLVAYNSVSAPTDLLKIGVKQPEAGQEVACVNPAALAGGSGDLITYVSTLTAPVDGVSTPTALFNGYFSAECNGPIPALVITPAPASDTELRTNPYDFATLSMIMTGSTNSLHTIDIDLTQGNLVALVQAQGDAKLAQ